MASEKLLRWTKRLAFAATLLALMVVILGAYTRLNDAGLGCPDWPGCYGFLTVPESHDAVRQANEAFPHRPVEAAKAWAEMTHRYFASTLGFIIVVISILSIINRKHHNHPLKLPLTLLGLVIFQGMLGMWTVTMSLFPPVVMSHLLGGFTTLTLLFLLSLRVSKVMPPSFDEPLTPIGKWAVVALCVLIVQIALGGWTASNYAAVVCTELPICQGNWWEVLNWHQAFQFWGHDAADFEYAPHLGADSKITIHITHRFGAMIATAIIFFVALQLIRLSQTARHKNLGLLLMLVLAAQVALGISNIVFHLPLAVAVAHNAVAALLLLTLVAVNYSLFHARSLSQQPSRNPLGNINITKGITT